MTDKNKTTWLDSILNARRIQKYLSSNAKYRQSVSQQLDRMDDAQERILQPTQDMVRAHLAFLDHLSGESFGGEARSEINPGRDYRLEFVTFYLTHQPVKKRPINRPLGDTKE
jgi:hypothetical protein